MDRPRRPSRARPIAGFRRRRPISPGSPPAESSRPSSRRTSRTRPPHRPHREGRMRNATTSALSMALLLLAGAVNGQTTTPTNTFSTPSTWPIQFSIGPQQDGGLGAKVSGSAYWSPNWQLTTKRVSGWAVFYLAPEATWGSQSNALNQTSISFRPAFQFVYTNFSSVNLMDPNQKFDVGPFNSVQPMIEIYGDLREPYGKFNQNDTLQNVNFTLYGISADAQIPYASRLSNFIPRKTNVNRITYAPAIR